MHIYYDDNEDKGNVLDTKHEIREWKNTNVMDKVSLSSPIITP